MEKPLDSFLANSTFLLGEVEKVDTEFLWVKVVLFLLLLIVGAVLLTRMNKQKVISSIRKKDGKIRIADSCSLGNRQYLVIAQCDTERFLLGIGPNNFQHIANLPNPSVENPSISSVADEEAE